MRVNRRLMIAFAELAPQMINRQQQAQMEKQEQMIATMAAANQASEAANQSVSIPTTEQPTGATS